MKKKTIKNANFYHNGPLNVQKLANQNTSEMDSRR